MFTSIHTTEPRSAAQVKSPTFFQPKLTVNTPGDAYEQEADQVADQVMRMRDGDVPVVQRMPLTPVNGLQRKCTECEKEEKEKVQRKESGGDAGSHSAPPIVSDVLSSGGGQSMDGGTRHFMESRFGQDFGQVRIHTGGKAAESAAAIQARAYTSGRDVVFGAGEYRPDSESGKRLLAHELVHVGQQGGGNTTVQQQGLPISKDSSKTIRRGEAPVHQGIELTTLGVKKPKLDNQGKLDKEETAAMEMYAGNWMRDFSQFNVPAAISATSKMPKKMGLKPSTETVGGQGATDIIYGLLRALAAMEFGQDITQRLMTDSNIGAYRPQEHMDNPAGMSSKGDLVLGSKPEVAEKELKGAAGLGPQVENSKLYQVNSSGLSNHIYNTTEWVKGRLASSVSAGASPTGRMHLGTALHGVEDFFSHSNFIEASLNLILNNNKFADTLPVEFKNLGNSKQGQKVDTLFDSKSPDQNKQAITTGTFGPADTKVSLLHVILPKVPTLIEAISFQLDVLVGDKLPSEKAKSAENMPAPVAEAATNFLTQGLDKAGVEMVAVKLNKSYRKDGKWYLNPLKLTDMVSMYDAPASEAVKSYQQISVDLKEMLELVTSFAGVKLAKKIMDEVIDPIIQSQLQKLKKQLSNLIFDIVEAQLGIKIPEKARNSPEEMEKFITEQTNLLTMSTSMESRVKKGGDLYGLEGEEKKRRIPADALPPSHSEISKDHPGHAGPNGKNDTRSPFYQIHFKLALAADKHIINLVETAWRKSNPNASVVPDKPQAMDPGSLKSLNTAAKSIAGAEKANATKEGRSYFQSTMPKSEETEAVLNAVDLYINHPAASDWWQTIVLDYMKNNPKEVLQDIASRNQTRTNRK